MIIKWPKTGVEEGYKTRDKRKVRGIGNRERIGKLENDLYNTLSPHNGLERS